MSREIPYVDIHCHHRIGALDVIELFSYDIFKTDKFDSQGSAGIHPWDAEKADKDTLLNVRNALNKKNVMALGEIGIDKHCNVSYSTQFDLFNKQLTLNEKKLPVIIHCVKAFPDLIEVKEKYPDVIWIIHRYSGSYETARELMKKGCYLSFGQDLFKENSKVVEVFNELPLERTFLETDDYKKHTIKEIYAHVSKTRGIPLEHLKQALYQNYDNIFGDEE